MAGSENYSCGAKRVQGMRVCVAIKSTISDHIIRTLLSFTERAALVKGRVIYRVPTMDKFNLFCCVHLLNRFRVNKGYTH